jgi:polyhydroxybutyrate depolymerase
VVPGLAHDLLSGRRPRRRWLRPALAVTLAAAAIGLWGWHETSGWGTTTGSETASAPPPATTTTTTTTTTATTTATTTTTATPPHWVTTTVHLTYDGVARYYLVTRPAGSSKAVLPLVVVLHGRDVSPSFEEQRINFRAVAGPSVLVYPAGYGESWNAGACCAAARAAAIDDVGFLTLVVHQVLATLPAPSARLVYLAGYSNGGKMAYRLACADPGVFRAVAIYGATPVSSCSTAPPVSLMVMASTGDPELTIGPGGSPQRVDGFVEPTVDAEVAAYRTADGCHSQGSVAKAGLLTTTTWSCAHGRTVALSLYTGGSHGWPAGHGATPSGQQAMWTFFVRTGAAG